jgi:predicted nuclease of predicted toxin-antitoxin system
MTNEPVRLLADAGVSTHVANALRAGGYDVVHVFDLGLHQEQDASIFRLAAEQSRTVITFDLDFPGIARRAPHSHSGIILIRMRHPRRELVLKRLRVVLAACPAELRAGGIVSLSESRFRLRKADEE